jgi:hypothetical protein
MSRLFCPFLILNNAKMIAVYFFSNAITGIDRKDRKIPGIFRIYIKVFPVFHEHRLRMWYPEFISLSCCWVKSYLAAQIFPIYEDDPLSPPEGEAAQGGGTPLTPREN